jgi:hypothetical protein
MPQNRARFGRSKASALMSIMFLSGRFADTAPDAGCIRLAQKAGLPPNRA